MGKNSEIIKLKFLPTNPFPNGGRTRKVRISKTKWGKIAKLKKWSFYLRIPSIDPIYVSILSIQKLSQLLIPSIDTYEWTLPPISRTKIPLTDPYKKDRTHFPIPIKKIEPTFLETALSSGNISQEWKIRITHYN